MTARVDDFMTARLAEPTGECEEAPKYDFRDSQPWLQLFCAFIASNMNPTAAASMADWAIAAYQARFPLYPPRPKSTEETP